MIMLVERGSLIFCMRSPSLFDDPSINGLPTHAIDRRRVHIPLHSHRSAPLAEGRDEFSVCGDVHTKGIFLKRAVRPKRRYSAAAKLARGNPDDRHVLNTGAMLTGAVSRTK